MNYEEMNDAIRQAAEAENRKMSRLAYPTTNASDDEIRKMRQRILVFLQACPDDATVLEMREILE